MEQIHILITAPAAQIALCEQLKDRLSESWSANNTADFCIVDFNSLHKDKCNDFDAVIVIAGKFLPTASVNGLASALDESSIPMVVVVDGNEESLHQYQVGGALVEQISTSDLRLCALIEALMHRQQKIEFLMEEAALARRFQGGIQGQMSKMHDEMQLAAVVQREFLPREIPTIQGMEFAALWRPSNYVSGDIYDLIRLDQDRVGVFVIDAVGHGVPAALMTMMICRSLVTKRILENGIELLEPSDVLTQLNSEMVSRQRDSTRFATAVYAIVDCCDRTVKLAGAGHPPPILLQHAGEPVMIETNGGLLGVFPDATYDQVKLELCDGDRLVFYTDGFEHAFPKEEATIENRRLPSDRYREEFEKLAVCSSASEMIETISQNIDDQVGSLHQPDDLTLVCVNAGPHVSSVKASQVDNAAKIPLSANYD